MKMMIWLHLQSHLCYYHYSLLGVKIITLFFKSASKSINMHTFAIRISLHIAHQESSETYNSFALPHPENVYREVCSKDRACAKAVKLMGSIKRLSGVKEREKIGKIIHKNRRLQKSKLVD